MGGRCFSLSTFNHSNIICPITNGQSDRILILFH